MVLSDDLLVTRLHIERRARGDFAEFEAKTLGKVSCAFPDGIIAEGLRAPFVIARHTAIVEHHAAAKINVADIGSIAAEGSAGARVDDKVGLNLLNGRQGSYRSCFTSHQVGAMLLSVQNDVEF